MSLDGPGRDAEHLRNLAVGEAAGHEPCDLDFSRAEPRNACVPCLHTATPCPDAEPSELLGGETPLGLGANLLGQGGRVGEGPHGPVAIAVGKDPPKVESRPQELLEQPFAFQIFSQRFEHGCRCMYIAASGGDGRSRASSPHLLHRVADSNRLALPGTHLVPGLLDAADTGEKLRGGYSQFGRAARAPGERGIRTRGSELGLDFACQPGAAESRLPRGDVLVDPHAEVGIHLGFGIASKGPDGRLGIAERQLDRVEPWRRVPPPPGSVPQALLEFSSLGRDGLSLGEPAQAREHSHQTVPRLDHGRGHDESPGEVPRSSESGPCLAHPTEREKRDANTQECCDARLLVELLGEEETHLAEADDVVASVLLHCRVDRRVKSGRVCRALGPCEPLEATRDVCHLLGGDEGPIGRLAAGSRLVVQPELDIGLEGIHPHCGLERDSPDVPGAVKVRMGFASQSGSVCGTGSLDLGMLPLERIVGELADAAPPLDGQLLLAQYPCQFAEVGFWPGRPPA